MPLRYGGSSIVPYPDAGVDAGTKVGCVPGDLPLTRATPVVMFVLDRSGSMNDAFSGTTRWRALRNALSNVLPPVDGTMSVGALIFPQGNSNSCSVGTSPDLTPAPMNVEPLLTLLQENSPGGNTPTSDALLSAARSLLTTHTATKARAMVLATDGAPNCNASLDPHTCVCSEANRCTRAIQCLDDTRTVSTVSEAANVGVPTWVIGIQDTNSTAISVLTELAVAGGHPQTSGSTSYYAATSQQELQDAFSSIRDQVGNCVYLTGSVPPDDGSIVITLDGVELPPGDGGWSWTNKDNSELAFDSTACDAVLARPTGALEAQVVCHVEDAGVDGGVDGGADAGP